LRSAVKAWRKTFLCPGVPLAAKPKRSSRETKDLLTLKEFQGVLIVTPGIFLTTMGL
jgi:hypothetical protein